MKRDDYENYFKKLNLSENQKDILLEKIDNDYLYFNINPDIEVEGFSAAFNNLYWLFLGELDTKDEFYDDEHDEVLRISVINDLEIEDDKKKLLKVFIKN